MRLPSPSPRALRVGLFAMAGMALLLLAVVWVAGGSFGAATPERGWMRFQASVYGLQAGAPVVLRGVKVGQVRQLALVPAAAGSGVAIEVHAEFDTALLASLGGTAGSQAAPGTSPGTSPGTPPGAGLRTLVQQGLVARLAQQSVLTGLLYVDLDLQPDAATAQARPASTAADGAVWIPTASAVASGLQGVQEQLQALDLPRIATDLAAVAAATRRLVDSPLPAQTLQATAGAASAVQALAQRLERDLAGPLPATLAEARATLRQLGDGARDIGSAAQTVQGQSQRLVDGSLPVLAELRGSAAALTRAATALEQAAAPDSPLRLEAERALQDVARAARSLRELGDTLDRHPDALLRGRASAAPAP